jgi:hypothetical protein
MRKKLILGLLICLLPLASHAQTITTVSGQVLDPNGVRYNGGQVTITIVPPSGGVSPYVTITHGPVQSPLTLRLTNTGTFSAAVVANASITPASTHYTFTVCGAPSQPTISSTVQPCFTVTGITIAGAIQNLSTTLNNAAVRLFQTWDSAREFNTLPAATAGSLAPVTMVTAPAVPLTGKEYTLTAYVSQTALGASCGAPTTIVLNAIFTDPNAAAPQTQAIGTFSVTGNGTLGIVPLTANIYSGKITFVAKPATAVQYSTTYALGTSCSPGPTVQVYPVLQMN